MRLIFILLQAMALAFPFISSTHKLLSLPKDEPHLRQVVGSGSPPPPPSSALCLYGEWAAILALSTAAACLPLSQHSSAGAVVGFRAVLFWTPPPPLPGPPATHLWKCHADAFTLGWEHTANTDECFSVRLTCHTGRQLFGIIAHECLSVYSYQGLPFSVVM